MKLLRKIVSIILATLMTVAIITMTASPALGSSSFVPRLTAPDDNNRFYLHTSAGGLNSCILGSGNQTRSVLPNCVGYAWGRAYEITGTRPSLSRGNGNTFWGNTGDGYARGQTPRLGAIACWNNGSHGHVAVVEAIHGDMITISESHWGGPRFETRTIMANGSDYLSNFQGFIYIGDFAPPAQAFASRADNIGDSFYGLIHNEWGFLTNVNGIARWDVERRDRTQIMRFQRMSNDLYRISALSDGRVLDVSYASTAPRTKIQFWESNDTPAQRWRIERNGQNHMFGPLCAPNVVIDAAGHQANFADGTQLYTYGRNNTAAQWFQIRRIDNPETYLNPPPPVTPATPAPTPPAPPAPSPQTPQHTVTVTAGHGGTASGGGSFQSGQAVTVTATPNQGWTFDGWFENGARVGTERVFSFNAASNRNLEARFFETPVTQIFIITVTSGQGGTASGGGSIRSGQTATVTATPNQGWTFDGWFENGARVNSNATWSFAVTGSRNIAARFVQTPVLPPASTFTISVAAGQGGTAGGGGSFRVGETAFLIASPNNGWVFDGWYDAGIMVSTDARWSLSVQENRSLEARFVSVAPPLSATPGNTAPPVQAGSSEGASSWAIPEIDEAISLGIIPERLLNNYRADITRAEFCRTVVRMLMVKSGTVENEERFVNFFGIDLDSNPFSDTSDRYINIAYELRIVNGMGDNRFSPHSPITRQEAATMLSRAAAVFEFTNYAPSSTRFDDHRAIAIWAAPHVDFLSANGIMQGVGSNIFNPHGSYTREQSFLTMLRLFNAFPEDYYPL